MFDYSTFFLCLFFLALSSIVTLLLLIINFNFFKSIKFNSLDKTVSYECGFEAFNSSRILFDIDFFLLLIFFILFDVEIVYIFPWITNIVYLKKMGHFTFLIFIILVLVGFYYEYLKGTLDWINDLVITW